MAHMMSHHQIPCPERDQIHDFANFNDDTNDPIIDSEGIIHVIINGSETFGENELHHFWQDGNTWDSELIDSATNGGNGSYFHDAKIDGNDKLHVLYTFFESSDEIQIWYATNKSGSWVSTVIWNTDSLPRGHPGSTGNGGLIIDDSGDLHVFWQNRVHTDEIVDAGDNPIWPGGSNDLREIYHAKNTAGDTWEVERVEWRHDYNGALSVLTVAPTYTMGGWLDLIGDRYDPTYGRLAYSSICYLGGNNFAVIFNDVTSDGIFVIKGGWGGWGNLATNIGVGDTPHYYYPGASLVAVSNGTLHAFYCSSTSPTARGLIHRTEQVGDWDLEEIGPEVRGRHTDTIVDNDDKFHVAYFNDVGLVYATNKSGAWQTEYVKTGSDFSARPRIMFDALGKINIFRAHSSRGVYRYYKCASEWVNEW